MAKQPKAKVKQVRNVKNLRLKLFLIPAIAFLAKIIWIGQLPLHGLYGADGENYVSALDGLLKDGLFSTARNLHYWPSGYSILMWPIAAIFKGSYVTIVGILQSLIYFLACAYFVDQLRRTRLSRFAYAVAFIFAFNPTLSMNTLAIGYETSAAALIILALGFMIAHFHKPEQKAASKEVILASVSFSLATFMQPRLAIVAFLILALWGLATQSKKTLALFLAVSIAIVAVGPGIMVLRNVKAMHFASISTNLGTTMFIGAGDEATGGYNGKYNGVPCPAADVGNEAQVDSAKVKCAISWYLHNPAKFLKLSIKKAIFFWSPWFGPVASGTMARNPWLKIHPFKNTVKTQEGINMVYGNAGKLVSWIWLLGQLFFMFFGFRYLWRANGLERLLGASALSGVVISWLTSIATIGDHRFRIPTMTLSLFLQAIGLVSLFGGKSRLTGSVNPLRWKSLERKANLLP